jgi:hypothetical protein
MSFNAPGGELSSGGMGLIGGQAVAGIEKTMMWKLMFFTGAVCVVVTAVGSLVHFFQTPGWASDPGPGTFMEMVFLLLCGILMLVLDLPIPHPEGTLVSIRDYCYKFALFLTRFTGRGLWYWFLGGLVFSILSDGFHDSRSWYVGLGIFSYLMLLGLIALVKGLHMSQRLHMVRKAILGAGKGPEHFLAPKMSGLRKCQFEALVYAATMTNVFNDSELDYIINALSFTPENDGLVMAEELEYWLSEGDTWLIV